MAWQVVQLPPLTVATTAALVTNAIGSLDDADSIMIFVTSSATTLTSGARIEVSLFDPSITFSSAQTVGSSSAFYSLSTAAGLFSTAAPARTVQTIQPVAFRGLRLSVLASASVAGEIVALVSKQIFV